jgi:hypothetical protein
MKDKIRQKRVIEVLADTSALVSLEIKHLVALASEAAAG